MVPLKSCNWLLQLVPGKRALKVLNQRMRRLGKRGMTNLVNHLHVRVSILEDIQANLLLTSRETPAAVTIVDSWTMHWKSTLLKDNHQDWLHLPHSAPDLDLSPLVVRQPDWQKTCGSAYFCSSHNEALTCWLWPKHGFAMKRHLQLFLECLVLSHRNGCGWEL